MLWYTFTLFGLIGERVAFLGFDGVLWLACFRLGCGLGVLAVVSSSILFVGFKLWGELVFCDVDWESFYALLGCGYLWFVYLVYVSAL